jgi:hypothetical protein
MLLLYMFIIILYYIIKLRDVFVICGHELIYLLALVINPFLQGTN